MQGVKLTPEEGFVLSRVDGRLSTAEIEALTGIPKERLESILGKLKDEGVVDVDGTGEHAPVPDEGYSNPWLGEALPAMGSDLDVNERSVPTVDAPRVLAANAAATVLGPEYDADDPPVLGPEFEVHDSAPPNAHNTEAELPDDVPTAPRLEDQYGVPGGYGADDTGEHPPAPRRASERPHPEDAGRGWAAHAGAEPMVLGAEHEVRDEEPPVLGEGDEVHDEGEPPVLGEEHEVQEGEGAPAEGAGASESKRPPRTSTRPPEADDDSRNYRKIYEAEFRHMERDARAEKATHVQGPLLLALCLDPDPQVIAAILKNMTVGFDHARMIATYHKTTTGLEFIVKRADFLRDSIVQRKLVRNDMLNESLMRRVCAQKRMADVYKLTIDREMPERNRAFSRGILRAKWSSAQAEERAELVVNTEGRCLSQLIGQTFDARTTAILCGRPYNSILFIQNCVRFPACPPGLLAHFLKQPFVKRQPQLRKLILQHPNVPSELKRLF
jgi:hypothetical protein